MNERSVNPIASVRPPETGSQNKTPIPGKTEFVIPRENSLSEMDRFREKSADVENEQVKNLSNISIQFNISDETNQVVVVVTDRTSGRVLRTIPASEFEKLHAGDLLKLAA